MFKWIGKCLYFKVKIRVFYLLNNSKRLEKLLIELRLIYRVVFLNFCFSFFVFICIFLFYRKIKNFFGFFL